MSDKISLVRGMNDLLPQDLFYWEQLESALKFVAISYGYQEVRFPIIEKTSLFKRTIGEVTDVVEKEMYTFDDRNGDSLSLRPEGTAGCVRLGIEQGLFYNQVQRLWYLGPMFRHERPQKGRYRQFYQFGLEAFGMSEPEVVVEQLLLTWRVFKELNLVEDIALEINSLGSIACRAKYRDALVAYFEPYRDQLDEDSLNRLRDNPLRILDSKNPEIKQLVAQAPQLIDCIDEEQRRYFENILSLLDKAQIPYQLNPFLVRGLDYYGSCVYEWVTTALGAQGTVCAGGRYDGLVEQLGGKSTPAVGFAMGLDRLVLLLKEKRELASVIDVYFILVGDQARSHGLLLAEQLRAAVSGLNVILNLVSCSMKSQFKRAHVSGARWAFVLGDDELEKGVIGVKFLRESIEQQYLDMEGCIELLKGVGND